MYKIFKQVERSNDLIIFRSEMAKFNLIYFGGDVEVINSFLKVHSKIIFVSGRAVLHSLVAFV